MAEDNTLLREGLSRLIEADSDLELASVGTNLPELLALIATNVHDAFLVAEELAAEGFFRRAAAEYAVKSARRSGVNRDVLFLHKPDRTDDALDEMLARFGEEPHVTIATESLVQQL